LKVLIDKVPDRWGNSIRGISMHVFVREHKEIDGDAVSYIYIGKGDVAEYEGEKLITVKIKLKNEIPVGLYIEFTKKV
jgi:uncharacterized protein involved in tellurium resistance